MQTDESRVAFVKYKSPFQICRESPALEMAAYTVDHAGNAAAQLAVGLKGTLVLALESGAGQRSACLIPGTCLRIEVLSLRVKWRPRP